MEVADHHGWLGCVMPAKACKVLAGLLDLWTFGRQDGWQAMQM